MATLRLDVELEYDSDMMHGDDAEGWRWFLETILGSSALVLHENDSLGDTVGTVRVLSVNRQLGDQ